MSRLGSVKKGVIKESLRFVLYGVEGAGKSTLAANAPSPIFFDVEGSARHLNTSRYTWDDGPSGHRPEELASIYAGVDDLVTADHDYRTLVVDGLDTLEMLIWKHCIKRDSIKGRSSKPSIEDYGYGKGYAVAREEMRVLLRKLDFLRLKKSMDIILIGHSHVVKSRNPEDEDYDRYELNLHKLVVPEIKAWADMLGFCSFRDVAADINGRKRGFSTGERIVRFQHSATFSAKSRIPMPEEIVLSIKDPWKQIADAIEEGQLSSRDDVMKRISEELARIGDEALENKVVSACETAGLDDLHRYLVNLEQRSEA